MNNIQKAFKLKGKRQGLRGFADGGELMRQDEILTAPPPNVTLRAGVVPGTFGNPVADYEIKEDNFLLPPRTPSGFGGRAEQPEDGPVAIGAPRRPTPLRAEVPDFPRRFEGGGEVKSKADLLLEEMSKKYGVSSAAPAPAPAAAPAAAAIPAPAPAPAPRGLFDRAAGALRGRAAQIDKAAGFADGGDIEPFVDDKGYIHGKPGIDKVPGVIEETGEPVRVGNGERIVNQKQNEALKRLAAQATGMHLDEFLEQSTGSPVGPKVKNGLRGAADGGELDRLGELARQARSQVINSYNLNDQRTAVGSKLAGGMSPEAAAYRASPTPAPAPTAAPAAMAEPLEFSAKTAPRAGIRGVGDRLVNAGNSALNAVKGAVGVGGEAAEAAAKTPLRWYQPSAGVKALGRAGATAVEAAPNLIAPVVALSGAHDMAEGLQHQENRDVSDIQDRGGFLASTLKDAFPAISAVGERIGNDVGRVVTAASGGINPNTGRRESVWESLTSGEGRGDSTADIYRRNTGAGSLSESSEQKAARLKAEAEANKPAPSPAAPATPAAPASDMHPSAAPADATQGTINTPRVGLRNTVSTPVGDVIASRGADGQLNVTNDPRATPTAAAAADEAARAKEADRLTKDMARQVAAFDDLKLKSDMESNDPEDRARAMQRLGLRKINSDQATANNKVAADMYGHNVALAGHQLDNATRVATLQNQQLQQNMERNNKLIEQLYPATIKGPDGKDMTNPEHQDFVSRLSQTLGMNGRHIGHLTPQDLSEFQTAYAADKKSEPGAFMKFYNKWIDGHPDVEDVNPFRQVGRAGGKEGRTNSLGFYRNANQALRWEPGVVGGQFLTGGYNRNVKDLIGE